MNGIGPSTISLLGWQAAGGINPVGVYTFNTATLQWEAQAPITSGGGGGAVTIVDGGDTTQGAIADAAVITDAGGTISGKLRGLVKWAFERMPASLGQKTMAASLPVSVASDQSTLPISAAALPLPTGAATEATLAARLAEATFTGRFPAAAASADGVANPTVSQIADFLMGWNGATWDRLRAKIAAGLAVEPTPVSSTIVVTGAANAIATATLPAAGAGLFHYITHMHIKRVATAALAGGALLTVTTTNLGGRAWRTGNQASITVGTYDPAVLMDQEFSHPIKSAVANTNTTIVGPAAGAAVSWHMVIDYYTAP